MKERFLALAAAYERNKKDQELLREQLEAEMIQLGVGTFIQDPDSGTVYKIVKPRGTFMYYRDIEYVRTAQEGERAGTLSKKEAEEAGFVLKK